MKKNIVIISVIVCAISSLILLMLFKDNSLGSSKNEDSKISNVISEWYEPLSKMYINDVEVMVSIAITSEELMKGLSDTPFLPKNVIKLFVFPVEEYWGIWMKDMNYAIDILWIDKDGKIVHKEVDVSPDTYPETFEPRLPAKYVIETSSGFMNKYDIQLGDRVVLPQIK